VSEKPGKERENVEKVRAVSEAIKDLPISDVERLTALSITAMGGNPVPFLVDALSIRETERAERENPKPNLPDDYTEIERIAHEMLIENTGAHILDSGGLYGRHWERNRKINDFRKTPSINVTVWDDGMIDVAINVYHFITKVLGRDELCERLEKEFYEFAEYKDGSWFNLMAEFSKKVLRGKYKYRILGYWNTYNFEYNLLSQVLQGITFEVSNELGTEHYVILQVHGGCDVRGGYTSPRFFKLTVDEDEFFNAMCSFSASCGCTTVYANCGDLEVWSNEEDKVEMGDNGLPMYWKPIPKHENAKSWEYKLVCEKCGKEVSFHPYMDDLF